MTGAVIRASKATAIRYEKSSAGVGPHGCKKLAPIPDPRPRRLEGPRPRRRIAPAGPVHQGRVRLPALDPRRPLPLRLHRGPGRREGNHLCGFLERAIADFAAHGITPSKRLRPTTPGPAAGRCVRSAHLGVEVDGSAPRRCEPRIRGLPGVTVPAKVRAWHGRTVGLTYRPGGSLNWSDRVPHGHRSSVVLVGLEAH
jgi:hypothetical protein